MGEWESDGSQDSHSMSIFPLDERESLLSLRKGVERRGGEALEGEEKGEEGRREGE